jgi:hypothetical protein
MEDDSNVAMDRVHHKQDMVHKDAMDRQGDILQDVVHLGVDKDTEGDLRQGQVLPDVVDVPGQDQLDEVVDQVQVRLDVEVGHRHLLEDGRHHFLGVRHRFRDLPDVHHRYLGVHRHRRQEDDLRLDHRDLNFEFGLCLKIESTDH